VEISTTGIREGMLPRDIDQTARFGNLQTIYAEKFNRAKKQNQFSGGNNRQLRVDKQWRFISHRRRKRDQSKKKVIPLLFFSKNTISGAETFYL